MEVSIPAVTGLVLRPSTSADLPFLETVYASSRETELAQTDWSAAQKAAFLKMQFDLQHQYYQAHYSDAAFHIVRLGGEDIGRLYLRRGKTLFNLIDIALLAPWRGQGIGTALLSYVLAEAEAAGAAVELHVEHDNPARSLYARSGFEPAGSNGVYLKLRRACAALAPAV